MSESFRYIHRAVEELVQRNTRPGTVQFFGAEKLKETTAKVIQKLLDEVPEINRIPLASQASRMHGRVCSFLRSLGRTEGENGMDITGIELEELPATTSYRCGDAFSLTGEEIQKLAHEAKVSYAAGRLKPEELFEYLDADALPNDAQQKAQWMAISGPVYVMFSPEFKPHHPSSIPIMAVSIAGINFAYSRSDREAFTQEKASDDDADASDEPRPKRRRVVNENSALLRMKEIMHHIFLLFQNANVKYPCLNAIGCGAFKGPFHQVPQLWARASYELLSTHSYSFEAVLYSLPNFGDNNFKAFQQEFEKSPSANLKTCVVMLEDRGMVCLADYLARKGLKAGILNPSDVVAVRQGYIGMYWDGGHIALEEVLAMQTTLLLQHKGINPALYRDPKRWVALDIDGAHKTASKATTSASSSNTKGP